ncbi:PepSY-like domain-containing protein [Elizabethkingia sp. HX XZB]|uniref:PepSY-like domain-containing protein n=1 Tax=Elizabethkingia sp. HX XZB TaxID=3003193 RepID=UPI002A243504|nr:PepSY-like domain-containing protein [Elizabethkingia sp. HX XZB]MDX8567211.1 PepSY-like domain-containing protein [Elizabethkingia sp. HX XZB]
MKKVFLTLLSVFTLSTAFISCNDGGDVAIETQEVKSTDLPAKAQTLIRTSYADVQVKEVRRADLGDNKFSYAVELADGSRLDFDTNGDWVTIDSRVKAVPAAAVPANISSYVKTNYPSKDIMYINKNVKGYFVKLTTNIKLSFDANGNFISNDW